MSSTGAERIRVSFNPSASSEVDKVKLQCVQLIDALLPLAVEGGEAGRCADLAMTKFEEGCMYAVKALTVK